MKPLDLKAIREREAAATRAPWRDAGYNGMGIDGSGGVPGEYAPHIVETDGFLGDNPKADHDFVVAAREDVPALLDELETLRGQLEAAVRLEQTWFNACKVAVGALREKVSVCNLQTGALLAMEWLAEYSGCLDCCPLCERSRSRDVSHLEHCTLDAALSAAGIRDVDRDAERNRRAGGAVAPAGDMHPGSVVMAEWGGAEWNSAPETCPTCLAYGPSWGGRGHKAGCALDAQLVREGFPDQASRDAERARRAGR